MKNLLLAALLTFGTFAQAQTKQAIAGSDTLAGALTDAIIQAGMDQSLVYVGGGSGNGEKNLLAGDQGLAPMSRAIKADIHQALKNEGNDVIPHVIALDGISVFVQKSNGTPSLDVQTVAKIFTCELTRWEQINGSGLKGDIHAFRRNDASGTTDAFKHFTGVKTFGACVVVVNETTEISEKTSHDPLAVGYAGLSGKVEGNRSVALSAKAGAPSVMPTTATIRDRSYPFARELYVYEITGNRTASENELALLSYITDRSFMDPIVQAHEFITVD